MLPVDSGIEIASAVMGLLPTTVMLYFWSFIDASHSQLLCMSDTVSFQLCIGSSSLACTVLSAKELWLLFAAACACIPNVADVAQYVFNQPKNSSKCVVKMQTLSIVSGAEWFGDVRTDRSSAAVKFGTTPVSHTRSDTKFEQVQGTG